MKMTSFISTREKLGQNSNDQDHQKPSLKQSIEQSTGSPQLQENRSCIICEKTCCHTYMFRTIDGDAYDL